MEQHSFARLFARGAALQRLPLPPAGQAQRWLLRLLARGVPAQRIAPLQWRFEALLGETSAAARALVYDWFCYKQLESGSWSGAAAAHPDSRLLDAPRVGRYLDDCGHGVVVATIHMGNYLDGLRQLRLAMHTQRPILVMRRKTWSDAEQRAFERIVGDAAALTVLRRGNRSVATAIRQLRDGAIVVVLFDLPARYGRTVGVDWFGRAARVVRGPAELAVIGAADVLPLFCHYDPGGASIAQVLPIIASLTAEVPTTLTAEVPRTLPVAVPRTLPVAQRDARVAAITQRLCTLAEQQIRRHPGQWAHWSLIDELLAASP
jgi:Bacterial lipid A biosynthesis acyltransferase